MVVEEGEKESRGYRVGSGWPRAAQTGCQASCSDGWEGKGGKMRESFTCKKNMEGKGEGEQLEAGVGQGGRQFLGRG